VELNKQMEAMEAQARAALEVTGSWKQTKEYADAQVLAIKAANGDLELQKSLMERIAHDRAMIEQSERLKKSYDTMRESWISNMDAMALSGQSFGDTMKNIFQDIVKEAYNMIIVENAAKSFAGGVTNILGSVMRGAAQSTIPAGAVTSHSGKYMHEGGVVPRLHNGLGPNEVPAILERGEAVVPKGGLNSMFTIVNQSSAPVKGRMMNQSFDGRRVVTSIILEDLDSNGPVSQKLGR
jgi:hypothetical protein